MYDDFEYRRPEVLEIWNDPLADVSLPRRIAKTGWSVIRRGAKIIVQAGVDSVQKDTEAILYKQAISSLKAHRGFKGSNSLEPHPIPWKGTDWSFYDYGGTAAETIDFCYWIDHTRVRPEDYRIERYMGSDQ